MRRLGSLALLTLLALAVRLHGLGWGLPELYEEAYPLKQAWKLWGFGANASFTWNPHWFHYPSLTIYLQFVGQALLYAALTLAGRIHSTLDYRVLYAVDPTPFVLMGRAITAVFGAATAPLTYALVERLLAGPAESAPAGSASPHAALHRGAAWTAALIVAFQPGLALKSQEIEVDVPLAFFVVLACWAALRLMDRATPRTCIAAGVSVGLAASTKYTGAITILPCAVALWSALPAALSEFPAGRRDPRPRASAVDRRGKARAANAARIEAQRRLATSRWLGLAIVVAAAAVAFVATSPYVLLDHARFLADLGSEGEHMQAGHFGAGSGSAWGFYAHAWMTRVVGWPLGLASVVAVVLAIVRRTPRALAIATMVVVYYALVGSWSMKADRYLIPLVPVAVALACAAIAGGLARLPAAALRTSSVAVSWAVIGLVCAAPTLAGWGAIENRRRPDPRALARDWIHAHVPEGAFVVLEPYGPSLVGPTNLLAMDTDVAGRLATSPRRPQVYATLSMPMFQVDPERSAAFYDLGLYPAVDLFVVTGAVRDRYRRDPASFAAQLAFYSALERTCARVASFPAAGEGSDITIFHRAGTGWFASRDSVPSPGAYRGASSGGENYFFWNLGLDYECTGQVEQAMACYRRGLRYMPIDANQYRALAIRLGHCLLASRSDEEALGYLRSADDGAGPGERAAFAWIRDQIVSGRPMFRELAVPRLGPIGG